MNAQTDRFLIDGPAGKIEVALDRPGEGVATRGIALVAHPHPLYGGTMDNKVVVSVARALQEAGVRLTHLDSHKHVHTWPPIFRYPATKRSRSGRGCAMSREPWI